MLKILSLLAGIILFIVASFFTTPPLAFPSGAMITVPEGTELYSLAEKLREERAIRSPFWFRATAILLGGERAMKAGQYLMSGPQNVFTIAWRIFRGDYDVETIKLTIPEGFNVLKISSLFDDRFKFFDRENFVALAPEGYLFPDTYFIPVTATASSTIKLMNDNFTRKISSTLPEIKSSGRILEEIIIIASLLEAETQTKEDREMASDILWKRLDMGMPLQVDSETSTYKFVGLPKNPINNPGLVSIKAALHPTPTPYLYFLTGKDGKMHYAKTFDEHKKNIAQYL
ncbi:MAG: endolytic transglycosylase MltG [Candidatus Zambryskibacteria bacterium]|nr:endolytic transglycosylase MltG [Candidatus Zambryskibacteria bacterium]